MVRRDRPLRKEHPLPPCSEVHRRTSSRITVNSTIDAINGQPFLVTDTMGFVSCLIAFLHGLVRWRDKEPGMGWIASGFGLLGVWFAATRWQPTLGPIQVWSPWYVVLFVGLACTSVGLVDFLYIPSTHRRRAMWATLLPAAIYLSQFVIIALTGVQIQRSVSALPLGAWFLSLGAVAWWAARREPGAGHAYVAAALWAIPLVVAALAIGGINTIALRFVGFVPLSVLGLTMLTVSLFRRRRALDVEVVRRSKVEEELKALNASLEQVVAQRTADLQDVICGLESFNRSVSHDLRGSLGSMAGIARMADEALQRGDDKLARRALPLIARQAESSTQLMAALLSLARVGDATLTRELIDLRRLVGQVVEQIAIERGSRGMPQIVVSDMAQVRADPELMKPVFSNLIGNAIKYGSRRIEIGASSAGAEVTVYVQDNGVGFDPQAASQMFAPFVRLHGQQFEGHGVGLSIVRRVVERHGGRVWAESHPGQGAVFRFSLPA
jgi:signal transduction histidine kinase